MRAISSRRPLASSASTSVLAALLVVVLRISQWRSATAATCGECVTTSTCTSLASRFSRSPTAAAVAPPMPESTSSNTMVAASPTLARQTFSASRKRDSSPPEAMRAIGAGGVPGLVATVNCTRSVPCSDHSVSAKGARSVTNFAFSSLSGPSSAATALSSRAAPLRRAAACASAAAT